MLKILFKSIVICFLCSSNLWSLAAPSSFKQDSSHTSQALQTAENRQRIVAVVKGLDDVLANLSHLAVTSDQYENSLHHSLTVFKAILKYRQKFVELTQQGERDGDGQWDFYNTKFTETLASSAVMNNPKAKNYVFSFREEKDAVGTPQNFIDFTLLIAMEALVEEWNAKKKTNTHKEWLWQFEQKFSQNAEACYLGRCKVVYNILLAKDLVFDGTQTLEANMAAFMKDYLRQRALDFWVKHKARLENPHDWSVFADFMVFREQELYHMTMAHKMQTAYGPFIKAFVENKSVRYNNGELDAVVYQRYFESVRDDLKFGYFSNADTDARYASLSGNDLGLPPTVAAAFKRMEDYMAEAVYAKIPSSKGWHMPFSRKDVMDKAHVLSYYYSYAITQALKWATKYRTAVAPQDIDTLRRQLTIANFVKAQEQQDMSVSLPVQNALQDILPFGPFLPIEQVLALLPATHPVHKPMVSEDDEVEKRITKLVDKCKPIQADLKKLSGVGDLDHMLGVVVDIMTHRKAFVWFTKVGEAQQAARWKFYQDNFPRILAHESKKPEATKYSFAFTEKTSEGHQPLETPQTFIDVFLGTMVDALVDKYETAGDKQKWLKQIAEDFSRDMPACYCGRSRHLYEILLKPTGLTFQSEESIDVNMIHFVKDSMKKKCLAFWNKHKALLQRNPTGAVFVEFMKWRESILSRGQISQNMKAEYPDVFSWGGWGRVPFRATDGEFTEDRYKRYFNGRGGEGFSHFVDEAADGDYFSVTNSELQLPEEAKAAFQAMEEYMNATVYAKIIPLLEGQLWGKPFNVTDVDQSNVMSHYYVYVITRVLAWLDNHPGAATEQEIRVLCAQITIENMEIPASALGGWGDDDDYGGVIAVDSLKNMIQDRVLAGVLLEDRRSYPLSLSLLAKILPQSHPAHAVVQNMLKHRVKMGWSQLVAHAGKTAVIMDEVAVEYAADQSLATEALRLGEQEMKSITFSSKENMYLAMHEFLVQDGAYKLLRNVVVQAADGTIFNWSIEDEDDDEARAISVAGHVLVGSALEHSISVPLVYKGQVLMHVRLSDNTSVYESLCALMPEKLDAYELHVVVQHQGITYSQVLSKDNIEKLCVEALGEDKTIEIRPRGKASLVFPAQTLKSA